MRKIMSLLGMFVLIVGVLAGCGSIEVGDQFILTESLTGGHEIDSVETIYEEMDRLEALGYSVLDGTMSEVIDLSSIDEIKEGEEVTIVEISNKHEKYLIEKVGGNTEIWVDKSDLEKAR